MTTYLVWEGEHQLSLQGDLNFNNATALFTEGKQLLEKNDHLSINLINVHRSDSAGLAVLLAWLKLAKKNKKRIDFINAPMQMRHYAEISGLAEILNFR